MEDLLRRLREAENRLGARAFLYDRPAEFREAIAIAFEEVREALGSSDTEDSAA